MRPCEVRRALPYVVDRSALRAIRSPIRNTYSHDRYMPNRVRGTPSSGLTGPCGIPSSRGNLEAVPLACPCEKFVMVDVIRAAGLSRYCLCQGAVAGELVE